MERKSTETKKILSELPFANEDIIQSSHYSQISKQTPSSSSSSSILKSEPNWIVHHGCSILSDSKNYKGTGTGAEDTGIYEGFDRTIERTRTSTFRPNLKSRLVPGSDIESKVLPRKKRISAHSASFSRLRKNMGESDEEEDEEEDEDEEVL